MAPPNEDPEEAGTAAGAGAAPKAGFGAVWRRECATKPFGAAGPPCVVSQWPLVTWSDSLEYTPVTCSEVYRSKSDDKARDSTKTCLKARGPGFAPVHRPEGSRDFYDTHLMAKYVYTGPISSTKKSSEPPAATKPPPSVIKKNVHRKKLATSKGKEVEGPTTSSDNQGSSERTAKKPRVASSTSVMHLKPLWSHDDADEHNLLLSTLTGGHTVYTEVGLC